MPAKIRLQRHGRKGAAIFHIVIADERAPRDGRFIENLGIYNPNTNPATIDMKDDRALDWLMKGAVPTDTVRAILSYKGVLLRKHLAEGVKKGALTEEQAQERFENWKAEKEGKITAKTSSVQEQKTAARKARQEAEATKRKEELAAVAAAEAEVIAAAEAEKAAAEAEAAAAEAPAAEEATEEAPAAEEALAAEEAPAAEEAKEEAPAAEAATEEAPAAEEAKEGSEEADKKDA